VTHRVGTNTGIDDVVFGIRPGAVLSSWADRPAPRKRLYRAADRPIARRVSEQFDATIFWPRIVGQPAAAYGGCLRSKSGAAAQGRPQGNLLKVGSKNE
jgi:hypothetical protein